MTGGEVCLGAKGVNVCDPAHDVCVQKHGRLGDVDIVGGMRDDAVGYPSIPGLLCAVRCALCAALCCALSL